MNAKTKKITGASLFCAAILGGVLYLAMHHKGSAEEPKVEQAKSEPVKAEPVAQQAAPAPMPVLATEPTVHFAYNSSELDSGTKAALDTWAKKMGADHLLTLELDGHCDERGSSGYNMQLGQQRADAAKEYLVNLGVEARRISTVSFGKSRPVASGHDEDSWAQNRRVELKEVTALSQR